jgi:hypothetical protein
MAALPAAAYGRTKRDLRGATIEAIRTAMDSDADSMRADWSAGEAQERAARLLG